MMADVQWHPWNPVGSVIATIGSVAHEARVKVIFVIFETERELPIEFSDPSVRQHLRVAGLQKHLRHFGGALFDAQLRRVRSFPDIPRAESKAAIVEGLGGHPDSYCTCGRRFISGIRSVRIGLPRPSRTVEVAREILRTGGMHRVIIVSADARCDGGAGCPDDRGQNSGGHSAVADDFRGPMDLRFSEWTEFAHVRGDVGAADGFGAGAGPGGANGPVSGSACGYRAAVRGEDV